MRAFSAAERLERYAYLGKGKLTAKFAAGEKLFVINGNGQNPSGLVNSASSPMGRLFCADCAREKASPSGEVAARQQGRKGSARLP